MTATQVVTRFFKEEGLGWLGITAIREAFTHFSLNRYGNEKMPSMIYSNSFSPEENSKTYVDKMLKAYGGTLEYAMKMLYKYSKTLRIKGGRDYYLKKYNEFLRTRIKKNYRKYFISDETSETYRYGGCTYRNGYHKIDFTLTNNDTCI